MPSNHPNLQNIPIRTPRGQQVRKAFVAKDDEHVLAYQWRHKSDNPMQPKTVYAYPNPTKDILTLINLTTQESVGVYDLLGSKQSIEQERNAERLKLNVSNLKRGLYFINVSKSNGDTKAIRFIKK